MESGRGTLLVVGAGYVGAKLCQIAAESCWRVIPVTYKGGGGNEACDIGSRASVLELRERVGEVDAVVHCASTGGGGVEGYESVFRKGVEHLTEAYNGVPLVFTSSTSVYSHCNGEVVNEESGALPTRATGEILRKAEEWVLENGGCIARLAGIYGPARSVFLQKYLGGRAVVEEQGERYLNHIHRDDAATALLFLAEQGGAGEVGGQIYNVVDCVRRTQLQTYQELSKRFLLPMPPFGAQRSSTKRGWSSKRVSSHKLQGAGWTPLFPDFCETAKSLVRTLDSLE